MLQNSYSLKICGINKTIVLRFKTTTIMLCGIKLLLALIGDDLHNSFVPSPVLSNIVIPNLCQYKFNTTQSHISFPSITVIIGAKNLIL